MPQEPQISVLSYKKRAIIFWLLVVIFVIAMPTLIFYTSGNRLIFGENETNIVSMGGIYLGNDLDAIEVYIDETQIEKSRLFRRALYLEDISAGMHRVHVQAPGLHTWVKELPVDPGIVTEAFSFNMPVEPQVRLISEYLTATGTPVIRGVASSSVWWPEVSLQAGVYATTSRATTTLIQNPEYVYVEELFTATSSTRLSLIQRMQAELDNRFTFSSIATGTATSTPTTTIMAQTMQLEESGDSIQARWIGPSASIPYYFCVKYAPVAVLAERYGRHVANDVQFELAAASATPAVGERVCRQSITLNRLGQDVYVFDFLPGSTDLVLLQLADGIYVTEIDDRSWQNTQLLYPGEDLTVLVDNGMIIVFDGQRYFEIKTTLE